MKKKSLLIIASLMIPLSSCNFSNNYDFKYKDWDPKLIDENLVEYELDSNIDYDGYDKSTFDIARLANTSHLSYGLLVVQDDYGKYGFYSLICDDYIYSSYSSGYPNYYIARQNDYVGFILSIYHDNAYHYFDGFGNEIYSGESNINGVYIGEDADNQVYCYDSYGTFKYYYNEDGSLRKTSFGNEQFQVGDKFGNPIISDDFFGVKIDGYKFSIDYCFVSVYNEREVLKTSYILPNELFNSNASFYIAGKSLIYQVKMSVSDDAKDYDYSSSSGKYVFKSYKMDITTGKSKEIELDYLIGDSDYEPYKDKNGKDNYSLVDISLIGKSKILLPSERVLVNGKGKIIANAENFYPNRFIKLSNGNYYNLTTKVLYNKKLKVISYLSEYNPIYCEGNGFVVSLGQNKVGFIDENGFVKVPFEYDTFSPYFSKNSVFAIKGNETYRINLNSFNPEFVDKNENIINHNNGLYTIFNNGEYSLCTASETLFTSDSLFEYYGHVDSIFGNFIFFCNTENMKMTVYCVS